MLIQLTVKLTKLTGELEEEKQLNRCLRDNQTTWQSRVSELEDGLAKKDVVSIQFFCDMPPHTHAQFNNPYFRMIKVQKYSSLLTQT